MEAVPSRRPFESDLTQQRLKAWSPILTPKNTIPSCFAVGFLFLAIGILLLIVTSRVVEITQDYSNCGSLNSVCILSFTVPQNIPGPIFVYYRLTNFYQNSRTYEKSISLQQLHGQRLTAPDLSDCSPLVSPTGNSLPVYYPCGMIALSFFNDTFSSFSQVDGNGAVLKTLQLSTDGITWASDKTLYQKNGYSANERALPPLWNQGVDPDAVVLDPHFQVWMRTAGLPTFRKLYAKINGDLPAGNYRVTINNVYDVSKFYGTKSLILTNLSFIGSKNYFLGYIYLVSGAVCIALAFLFLYQNTKNPRRLGDIKYLSWNKGLH